ncbi:YfhD family protein [Paenibacillus harenae]|uniref:YfhD family protein n=1 Tax=Paenibacillus harenae TaxID=306543 RepID=UPI00040C9FCF|nr:YfhD family protein [Paenibacillus harenae]
MENNNNLIVNDNEAEHEPGKIEDVEFSEELADEADRKAMQRAAAADQRNEEQ